MTAVDENQAKAFAVRLWTSCLATQELLTVYIGLRLGLYRALADAAAPVTAGQLARSVGVAPRYVREWLEQQAVAGILEVDPAEPADERGYVLSPAHRRVLVASEDPLSVAAVTVLPLGGIARAMPELLAAYRSGAGVPDSVFGDDWREGHSGANRALFAHHLAGWIRTALPDVHRRLSVPGARILDVACGTGWSSIALARAYRTATVHGVDLDAQSIGDAVGHAKAAGVTERTSFDVRDAGQLAGHQYDLVCLFDALHEMPRPVEVLAACRAARAERGTVLVMDARVAAEFTAPGDEVERFQYNTSVLHCLPAALTDPAAAGTGTVLRPGAVRELARQAGFADAEELAVYERFHRFYRLVG